jgi:CHAT domain-containing protein
LVAVLSDPVYALDDPRFPQAERREAVRLAANFRSATTTPLTRLAYAGAEARTIASRFSKDTLRSLSGFRATRDGLTNLPFKDLRILHIAAHAIAREDMPMLSALYLSALDERGESIQQSRLTADEVLALGIRADLVVLSGCGTADGRALSGEGILGLTHSFLANGSNSVVASLWPVTDASTARFMSMFYEALAFEPTVADALSAAQRRSIAMPDLVPPATWASFVARVRGL